MRSKSDSLSPHSKKILQLLCKSKKPLSAYDILDKLRKFGIKAPPTVYRALDSLLERGMIHRIESLNAFVACHGDEDEKNHAATFAVCRNCGDAIEIDDDRLSDIIKALGVRMKFRIEHAMLELLGLCHNCVR